MQRSLSVIHIEDDDQDSELIEMLLRKEGLDCTVNRIATVADLAAALEQPCDLILADYTMPGFTGLEALEVARKRRPEIPFIFVSGTIRESVAIDSLRNGASDYILKDRLWQLVPAVRHALTQVDDRVQLGEMATELRATRKLASVATMSSGLVHDFRNMLQIFKLNLELLSRIGSAPAEVKKIADQLNKVTERGCDMMQEFMVFARNTESHLTAVDLAHLIADSVESLRPVLPASVKLQTALTKNLPRVNADAGQVDRMLVNLVRNASDAMPDGGIIWIAMDLVRFDSSPESNGQVPKVPFVRLMITDNGTGMDEATRSRIFEPFFTTKAAGKGTGLGLPVVLGLIEAHNGFIDVQSEVGKGTTFSLFFPTLPRVVAK